MIGIIGAMEEEVAALKEAMTIEENVTFASMDFCKGTLCGKAVVVVRSGIGKVNAAICTQILVDKFGVDTLVGRIVSGDQFVSSAEVKEKLVSNFGAKCTEMEGAAIAHAAYLNKVSCVIIRAISDKADNSATMDYPEFEKQAITHSVRLVKSLLPRL